MHLSICLFVGFPAVCVGLSAAPPAARTTGSMSSLSQNIGDSALRQVQWLGQRVAQKEEEYQEELLDYGDGQADHVAKSVYQQAKSESGQQSPAKEKQVWEALAVLEQDMQMLDTLAGTRPQLSAFEAILLMSAVISAGSGPLIVGGHLTEFLAPSAAAFTAAIGIGAEYTGKKAVADGKEVAAAALQCAAEAEGFLANAERSKAITPLCVGVGATAASFALLVPVLLETLGIANNLQLVTEIYLLCPFVSVLAAAVAALALQETKSFASRAIGVGNRRFARSGLVGRTWMSTTELVAEKSSQSSTKWKTFSLSVIPAPLIGAIIPGALQTKTIVVAALAAAQSAFFLTQCEAVLSRANDAVALKSRSAAVSDTYANQGARSAAILPFTSALASLCAAATAAIVELPFLESMLTAGTPLATTASVVTVSGFPAFAALFTAAASVSKARCLVDAEAAMQAASTIALQHEDAEDDPILSPFRAVAELIRLSLRNSVKEPLRRLLRRVNLRRRWKVLRKWFNRDVLSRTSL